MPASLRPFQRIRSSLRLGLASSDAGTAGFARIRQYPGAALQVTNDVRKLVLAKFPYSLIYETREDSLRILAVAHQRKRPYYWRGRR
jgi:toxin ParE1/3/4